MRTKIIRIMIAISAFVLIAGLCWVWLSKHAERDRLNRLYKEGLKPINDKDNIYNPAAGLAYEDSAMAVPGHPEGWIMQMQFDKATTLLRLGEEKKAIALLEALVEKLKNSYQGQLFMRARSNLALAYLRLGERNNCISGHCQGSCIFPIQGSGVYTDPSATQKSIELYQELMNEYPNDLVSRWLLNVAYMTLGEYPRKVPSQWLIPGLDTDTSSCKIKPFLDMAGDLKLNADKNQAGGSIVDDFNNDGYLDIVTSSWDLRDGMHYFKNNGDGTFTDVSKESGLSTIKGGLNIIQADYNNDGYTDILVLRGAWQGEFGKQPKTLLRNNGDGTFTDVTVESGILSFHPSQTATWADFNNDGWLDLFVGNETRTLLNPHPSELYINNHDGTFTNVANEAGCQDLGFM